MMSKRSIVVAATVLFLLPLIGCKYSRHSPFGSLGSAVSSAGNDIMVRGWALDLDRPDAPVSISITVNGVRRATVKATVPQSYPGSSLEHSGFSALVPGSDGPNRVCATVANLGSRGTATSLGCLTAVIDHGPNGGIRQIDGLRPGWIYVRAWAYDPDDPSAPVDVVVQVDRADVPFELNRSDRAAPGYDVIDVFGQGGNSSLFIGVQTAPGTHQVCIVARNIGRGADRPLGCSDVTVVPVS